MDEHDVRIGIRVHTNRGVGEVVCRAAITPFAWIVRLTTGTDIVRYATGMDIVRYATGMAPAKEEERDAP